MRVIMGNRPVPTKIKLLTGNPGKQAINKSEPEPLRGIPPMPKWLSEFPVAVEEWNRESTILDGMGVLTMAEAGMLAHRCYLSSEIQQMAVEIKKEGRVAYTSRMDSLGNEVMDAKANPKAIQIKNLITEYRQLGSLLGMDPASRTRISVDLDGGKKSKFSGLVSVQGGKR
jgi:P27 family predicted phage terminase small subunit